MTQRRRMVLGVTIVVSLFLFVQLAALALVQPFGSQYQPVENPENPVNSLVYFGVILVATGIFLLAFRLGGQAVIRAIIVLTGAWLSLYVFREIFPSAVTVYGANVLAVGAAGALAVALYVHPEWYVVDAAGVFMGAGAAGLFGISLGILPALVLLVVLAVYDAVSVYGTEHMLDLASGVLDMKVPVVLVIPMTVSYSFLDDDFPDPTADDGDGPDPTADDGDEPDPADGDPDADESVTTDAGGEDSLPEDTDPLDREVLFIGLGDAVIPTVLVASAAYFLPRTVPDVTLVAGVPLPAVTAMVGTFAGLAVLLSMVMKGKPHAGLPLLNGGTIAGYLLGAVVTGLTFVQATGIGEFV